MLKRRAWDRIEQWKSNKTNQGLLVTGARQVGKTYLIREYAKANYSSVAEINLIENKRAAAQELRTGGADVYYYNNKKRGELDFVTETLEGQVLPIEVKSGKDYKRHNALSNLMSATEYDLAEGFVLCDSNLKKEGNVTYMPVYMAGLLAEL
jgi:predicted AAA+ superfamily ATPase